MVVGVARRRTNGLEIGRCVRFVAETSELCGSADFGRSSLSFANDLSD
jgi:hypothetical protein